jgi:hypothetical protein
MLVVTGMVIMRIGRHGSVMAVRPSGMVGMRSLQSGAAFERFRQLLVFRIPWLGRRLCRRAMMVVMVFHGELTWWPVRRRPLVTTWATGDQMQH